MNAPFVEAAIRTIAIASITGYQKHISPRKGFSCAHRLLYGGESCSQYIKRLIATQGLSIAIIASRQRFAACKEANQILRLRASSNPEEANEEGKSRRKSKCGSNCADAASDMGCELGCEALEECGAYDCGTPDCGDCSSGLDCSGADCGSGMDCSSACCSWSIALGEEDRPKPDGVIRSMPQS